LTFYPFDDTTFTAALHNAGSAHFSFLYPCPFIPAILFIFPRDLHSPLSDVSLVEDSVSLPEFYALSPGRGCKPH